MDDLVSNLYALIDARLNLMLKGFFYCVRKEIEHSSI